MRRFIVPLLRSVFGSWEIRSWNKDFTLLALACASVGIFGGIQATLYNNFVVDRLNIEPHQLGIAEALREVPGLTNVLFLLIIMLFAPPVAGAACLLIMGLGLMAYTQVDSIYSLVLFSMLWSVGFHCWMPISQTMALRYSQSSSKGRALGQLKGVQAMAGLLTIAFCWGTYRILHYNGLFMLGGAVTILGGLAIFFASRNPAKDVEKRFVFKKRYWLFYTLQFLQGCRKQMFITFAIFALVKIHGMPVETTIILILINQIIVTLTGPYMGRLIDHYGEQLMLSLSYIGLAAVFIGYALINNLYVLYGLYCIDNMIFFGGIALTTYLFKIAPSNELKPTIAMGVTWNHIASVAAPLLGGYAWDYFGYRVVFIAGALLALISLVFSQWIRRTELLYKPAPLDIH